MREKEENILEQIKYNKLNKKGQAMKPEHKENNNTEEKKIKNSNFIDAWKNAINGIIYATTTQGNIKKQLIIAVAVVIISLFFNLNKAEFLIFLFTIILIIFAEMVNTAIETVVDLYVDVYHPKAKIAKDVAAGGVVITAINAIIVAYFLFFDKISDMGISIYTKCCKFPYTFSFCNNSNYYDSYFSNNSIL